MSESQQNWLGWHTMKHPNSTLNGSWEDKWNEEIKERTDYSPSRFIKDWGEYQGDCWECLVLCMRVCFWAIKPAPVGTIRINSVSNELYFKSSNGWVKP